jgi:hypothetical protein
MVIRQILVALLLASLPSAATAQNSGAALPKIASAVAPVYPPLARQGRAQGVVTLHVMTDGKRVSAFEAESGPGLLVRFAKENVQTWEFEPHTPTRFDVRFQYRLIGYHCEPGCNCRPDEQESVILKLPGNVDLSAAMPMICDPAEEIGLPRRMLNRVFRLPSAIGRGFAGLFRGAKA